MSPNRNYISGRTMEYARKKFWEDQGHKVIRAAGSHGLYDLVTFSPNGTVQGIQCKVTDSVGKAEAMLARWKTNPPLPDRATNQFIQTLEVKVKHEKGVRSATV